jgi:putative DNA primase/helicase
MTGAQVAAIPAELVDADRWIAWRYEERTDKHGRTKQTKVPVRCDNPTRQASSTDPATWTTFTAALAVAEEDVVDGAGFVLGGGYAGIDLDGCRHPTTGKLHDDAFRVIARLKSYTEISPSGTGVKIFCRGTLPEGRRAFADVTWKGYLAGVVPPDDEKYELAMFATARYFAVTGQHLEFTPASVEERTAELAELHASVFPPEPATNGARPHDPTPVDLDDGTLIERAMAAANGPKFRALWNGDIGGYASHSEADQALCNLLAFWAGADGSRMDALFRQSGLMREKWQRREGYRKRTIARALASCTETYSPHAARDEYRGPQAAQPEEPPMPDDDAGTDTRLRRAVRGGATTAERDLTDSGNADHLVQIHGERLHFIPPWGKWVVCGVDGFWTLDYGDVLVRELAKDVGRGLKQSAVAVATPEAAKAMFSFAFRSMNAQGITGMVNLARGIDGIPMHHEELDADGWLLGVENGVIDLRTGRLRPTDPADLMTLKCATPWDAAATAPRWAKAMEEWFPDEDVRGYVQRVAGAALVGEQRDHVFVIHYGGGRNGKGTFTRALRRVLGPYAGVIHLSLLVETKHSSHDTEKAALFRTRLAVASETKRRVPLDEASVKNLTGNDPIHARRMREDPWEFNPTHSLWIQTNHLPEIGGRDTGIWSRIRVVEWVATFEDESQDKDLDDKLAAEAPGILRWLVDGCMAWQRDGLAEPEAVVRATLEYRRNEDVLSRFAADCDIRFGRGLSITVADLNEAFDDWARAEGAEVSRKDFGDWLKENKARQKRRKDNDGKQFRVWEGVGR